MRDTTYNCVNIALFGLVAFCCFMALHSMSCGKEEEKKDLYSFPRDARFIVKSVQQTTLEETSYQFVHPQTKEVMDSGICLPVLAEVAYCNQGGGFIIRVSTCSRFAGGADVREMSATEESSFCGPLP